MASTGEQWPDEYITEQGLQARYFIPPRTAQRWRSSGDGPSWIRLGRRRILIASGTWKNGCASALISIVPMSWRANWRPQRSDACRRQKAALLWTRSLTTRDGWRGATSSGAGNRQRFHMRPTAGGPRRMIPRLGGRGPKPKPELKSSSMDTVAVSGSNLAILEAGFAWRDSTSTAASLTTVRSPRGPMKSSAPV